MSSEAFCTQDSSTQIGADSPLKADVLHYSYAVDWKLWLLIQLKFPKYVASFKLIIKSFPCPKG